MKTEIDTGITRQCLTVDENYNVTHCNNGYVLEFTGRDKSDDWVTIKHLVLKHDELVDALIELDQFMKQQHQKSK